MGLFHMHISTSVYEPTRPVVGRVSFAPEFDSKSNREVLAQRKRHPITVRMGEPHMISYQQDNPNPNPRFFHVMTALGFESNGALVVKVRYPGCTTFEGVKVLVFANATVAQLRDAHVLDPHFTDQAPEGALVPVARFEPTERGWQLALKCAEML